MANNINYPSTTSYNYYTSSGKLYDSSIYKPFYIDSTKEKEHNDTKMNKECDLSITAVENGYVISISKNVFVFPDLPSAMDWIEKNMKTPKDAKEFVAAQKPKYKNMFPDGWKDDWGKSIQPIAPQIEQIPYQPLHYPGISWTDTTTIPGNSTTSNNTDNISIDTHSYSVDNNSNPISKTIKSIFNKVRGII